MKNPILRYELRHWIRSPLAYFLVISMTAFAFVSMLGTGGYFDGPIEPSENVSFLNSAYALSGNSFLFAKVLLFLVAIFFGFSTYRDYQHNSHHILYSYPLRKSQYLIGKFLSAALLLCIAVIGVYTAIWAGEFLLGTNNPKITDFQYSAYWTACFLYLLPTLLIIGSFVFIVVTLMRNIYAGFITVICFALLQMILESTLFNSPGLLAILDPFGQNAFFLSTQDWNQEMRNSASLPIDKFVFINRAFWGILAVVSLYVFSKKFDFHHAKAIAVGKRYINKTKLTNQNTSEVSDQEVAYKFNIISNVKSMLHLSVYDVKHILSSWMFILFSFFGIATIFFIQLRVSITGDYNLLPMTRLFLGAPLRIYTVIIILSTFLFSSIIMERARTNKMNLLMDASPIKNWQLISSKIFAIMMMHIIQLILFFIISVIIQLINGYQNLDMGLYFIHLFILTFPVLFVWNITSVFSHSLLPNSMISMFLLACLWMGSTSMESIGINTHLLKYNNMPFLEYSDFNGYGSQLKGYFIIMKYWIAAAIMLIPGLAFIWKRGTAISFSDRLGKARKRMSPLLLTTLFLSAALVVFNASSLYQAEQESDADTLSSEQMNSAFEQHKNNWQQYEAITQPMISSIDLDLDLFPKQRRFHATGKYVLTNKSDKPIDTLFIRTGFDEITEINLNGKAKEILKDEFMKCHLYQLEESLSPGDSIIFSFTISNRENNVLAKNSNVLRNGTFLKQDILPRLGYQFSEHKDKVDEHGDHKHHFYYRDAHEVRLKTNISTSKDQVAIAPGELLSSQVKEGRNHFEYSTTIPQKLNFSFHSGDYEIVKDSLGDIKIELYYQKTHDHNTSSMIAGLKASLDFNSFFGEYPYKHIRIIEFPHTEESFGATLTGNNIPSSEQLFSMNTKTMSKINFPYYVMVHELTHEWFGNQLKAAAAPGAKMLSESITEYITLCAYRKNLGEEMANNFLKVQYERYKKGKVREKGEEPPLYLVKPHQDYIAYGKGAIALNEISKRIGEDKMKEVLKLFLEAYGKNQERYPDTSDFIRLLKSQVSIADHQLIDQWLMKVIDFGFEDINN